MKRLLAAKQKILTQTAIGNRENQRILSKTAHSMPDECRHTSPKEPYMTLFSESNHL